LDLSSSGRPHELVVEGKKIDAVKITATRRPGRERVTMFDFDPTWSTLMLSSPQVYSHTGQPRTEVLWRTLCADSTAIEDVMRAQDPRSEQSRDCLMHEQSEDSHSSSPSRYANQFRDQLCAMLLAHAERAADLELKLKLSPGGVLLQALVGLQLGEGGGTVVTAPTEEEIAHITDTSLTGPYFSSPAMQQALAELEALYQADDVEAGGPGCATPSHDQVATYLEDPKWRVWWKSTLPTGSIAAAHYNTDARFL